MPTFTLRSATAADGATIAQIQLAEWRSTYGHLSATVMDGVDADQAAQFWARAATDPEHRLRVAELDRSVIRVGRRKWAMLGQYGAASPGNIGKCLTLRVSRSAPKCCAVAAMT
jgi:hypothetical protein